MAFRINGDNADAPGQITVQGVPTSRQHVIQRGRAGTLKNYVQALDLNAAAPVDLSVLTVDSRLYVPVRVVVYNPSADVSAATLGFYTAAGGGGTEIVAPTLLATLNGTGKFQSLTVTALTSAITATTLYPRLTVAAGAAGTASLVVEYLDLEEI